MRRLLLVALLLLAGCPCLPMVPEQQAARDLGCPAPEVHVALGWRTQIASGCGRSVTYVRVCSEDGKACRFEAKRSWALRSR